MNFLLANRDVNSLVYCSLKAELGTYFFRVIGVVRRVFGASECDFHNSKISPSLKNFAVIIGHAGLALSSSFPLPGGGGGRRIVIYPNGGAFI